MHCLHDTIDIVLLPIVESRHAIIDHSRSNSSNDAQITPF